MELFNESPFNKLPKELIYIILSYTYQPQSKELTEDIRSFYESKQKLLQTYHNYWIIICQENEPSDKEWITNDLYRYSNKNSLTIYGYVNDFFLLFYRKFNIRTKEQVYQYITKLDNKSLDSQINIFWGLLNPKERNEFISIYNFLYFNL
jgi:hypothetical protein